MKNLKEFKALILRYESITLEEIEAAGVKPMKLTGFGQPFTCTLCKPITKECDACTWVSRTGRKCDAYDNHNTYKNIAAATSAEELKTAFRERAKYMRRVLSNEM